MWLGGFINNIKGYLSVIYKTLTAVWKFGAKRVSECATDRKSYGNFTADRNKVNDIDIWKVVYDIICKKKNQVASCGSDIITDDLRTTPRCQDSTQLYHTKDAKPALQATPFQPRKQYVHSGIYRGARSRQEGRGCHQRSREG